VAQVQYRTGLTDYLVVIDAERTLLANQLVLAQSRNSHLAASIHLIKALGGGCAANRNGTRLSIDLGARCASAHL
jgi:outer membrane protein TolC